jgi:hypothetical protein
MILDNGHIAQDVLEEYALGRLNEADEEAVEEHLLLCEECQDRLTDIDDFIGAIRAAAPAQESAQSRPKNVIWDRLGEWTGGFFGWKPVYAAGAIAAALAIIVLAPGERGTAGPAVEVSLEAVRGDASRGAEVAAGRPLVLKIDLTGLEGVSAFAVEVADVMGQTLWRTTVESRGETAVRVNPEAPLGAGTYWVRAYDAKAPGELLREFGLTVRAAE